MLDFVSIPSWSWDGLGMRVVGLVTCSVVVSPSSLMKDHRKRPNYQQLQVNLEWSRCCCSRSSLMHTHILSHTQICIHTQTHIITHTLSHTHKHTLSHTLSHTYQEYTFFTKYDQASVDVAAWYQSVRKA